MKICKKKFDFNNNSFSNIAISYQNPYKISKVHRLNSLDSEDVYTTGLIIEVFGKKIYKKLS